MTAFMGKVTFSIVTAERSDRDGTRSGWIVEMTDGERCFPFSVMFDSNKEALVEAERLAAIHAHGATAELPRLKLKAPSLLAEPQAK